jgi:hypothetical protein
MGPIKFNTSLKSADSVKKCCTTSRRSALGFLAQSDPSRSNEQSTNKNNGRLELERASLMDMDSVILKIIDFIILFYIIYIIYLYKKVSIIPTIFFLFSKISYLSLFYSSFRLIFNTLHINY